MKVMGKKFMFMVGYFLSSLIILFALTGALLSTIFNSEQGYKTLVYDSNAQKPKYQALPEETREVVAKTSIQDGRVTALQKFFAQYESPLEPYARLIVELADKYNLDYRLVPAIAMKESTLCHKIPKDSYNCWGYGIYGGKVTHFEDFEKAINTVSKGLGERYVGIGLVEPAEIMTKYNPVSTGSWAETVSFVMEKISTRL
jgi:hypothetical protein